MWGCKTPEPIDQKFDVNDAVGEAENNSADAEEPRDLSAKLLLFSYVFLNSSFTFCHYSCIHVSMAFVRS